LERETISDALALAEMLGAAAAPMKPGMRRAGSADRRNRTRGGVNGNFIPNRRRWRMKRARAGTSVRPITKMNG